MPNNARGLKLYSGNLVGAFVDGIAQQQVSAAVHKVSELAPVFMDSTGKHDNKANVNLPMHTTASFKLYSETFSCITISSMLTLENIKSLIFH